MFTGLVQAVGRVVESEPLGGVRGGPGRRGGSGQAGVARAGVGRRLVVDPLGWVYTPAEGDSVAVNGVCLTVARGGGHEPGRAMTFHAVPETLAQTTLGGLGPGSAVNLEHAATLGTFMGGHLVQGHVDGTGMVERVQRGADWRVRITIPRAVPDTPDLFPYLVPKGSITVNGVSLTVASIWEKTDGRRGFEVALIPTTLERTTLRTLKRGEPVNLEADMIAKTVVTWLTRFSQAAAAQPVAGRRGGRVR